MDTIYLKSGFMITTPITTGDIRKTPITATVVNRTTTTSSSISSEKPATAPWGFSVKFPFTSFFSGHRNRHDALAVDDAVSVEETNEEQIQRVRDRLGCDACSVDDEQIEFDKSSFSKLLRRVSLTEARLYCQMSYLGTLAYSIPQIKPGNLLRRYRLRFVTSSLEKKAQLAAIAKAKKDKEQEHDLKKKEDNTLKAEEEIVSEVEQTGQTRESDEDNGGKNLISASTAYHIAASAASFLHSQTKSIVPFKSSEIDSGEANMTEVEVASLMVKQAVADDLNSMHSSPCEWYICDDDESTRYTDPFGLPFIAQHTSLKPLGDRVLVKIKDAEEKTVGGIPLTSTTQTKPQGVEVVAVGEGKLLVSLK